MKKEWLAQFIAFLIFFLNDIIHMEQEEMVVSKSIGVEFLFMTYHLLLFLFVNYVLIPNFFNSRKYLQFFVFLIGTIILFGIVEEGVVEKILTPDSRGRNDVTLKSIYWFLGEILVPLLTFMSIKFVFDNVKQQQKLEKIEQNRLRNELKLLKSQIQPHILFNSLNSLYHFALKKSEELPDLILKLSNVLRYVVYEGHEEKVLLAKELSFIKDYIDLQEVQYEGRGDIHYDIQLQHLAESTKIAPFLLIPFIENCFKHSFGTKIKDVFVDIRIIVNGQELTLKAENNFEENRKKEEELIQGGIGLKNVEKRLQLLYPNQHRLTIDSDEQRYMVDLYVKLN